MFCFKLIRKIKKNPCKINYEDILLEKVRAFKFKNYNQYQIISKHKIQES